MIRFVTFFGRAYRIFGRQVAPILRLCDSYEKAFAFNY